MDALLFELLVWLSDNTDHDLAGLPLPEVVMLDARELTREAYSDAADQMPADGIDERLKGLYSWDDGPAGTIFVLNDDAGGDPFADVVFQERLLHELVHHVQYHGGAYERFDCVGEGEREAYRLGGLFFADRSVIDPEPMRFWLSAMYSRC